MYRIAAIVLALAITPAARAQAFGIRLGSNVKQYSPEKTKIDYLFNVTPPSPYVEFDAYTAMTDPSGEICTVSGLGKTYSSDTTGTLAREAFKKLRIILEKKYGGGAFTETGKNGALDFNFQQDIDNGKRAYETEWREGLPAGVGAITLSIQAIDSGTYLTLNYRSSNFLACMERRQQADTTGL